MVCRVVLGSVPGQRPCASGVAHMLWRRCLGSIAAVPWLNRGGALAQSRQCLVSIATSASWRGCHPAAPHALTAIMYPALPCPARLATVSVSQDVKAWDSTGECLAAMKAAGYQIVTTHLTQSSITIQEVDWTRPTAVVLGNEKFGVSAEAVAAADACAIIPMTGARQRALALWQGQDGQR